MKRGDQSATRRWVIGIVAIAVIAALLLGGRQLAAFVPGVIARIESLGPLGPAVFVLAYVVAAILMVPGSLLTLAAGAVFGVVAGSIYVFVGAVLGATAAFLVARYLARAPLERRFANSSRFRALDAALGADGRKVVFLIRLSPVFPYTLLNYLLGLTSIRLVDFVVASLGMIPGTIAYTYAGKVVGDLSELAAGGAPARGPAYYALLAVGFVATVVVTVIITRIAKRALTASAGELVT
ncbi:MAG: TVP38/TMEM64 family protein [Gemmatimonadales bacterium]|nr:TVP38/TMEM64 family protein [Gemmatimonadales bacterium]